MIKEEDLDNYAFSRLIEKFLENVSRDAGAISKQLF